MDKNELIFIYSSVDNENGGASVLKIHYVISQTRCLSDWDLLELFQEFYPNAPVKKITFGHFDELKNFITFLCDRFKNTHYKLLALNQYNEDQKNLDRLDNFHTYFDSLKKFPVTREEKSRKGLLNRFLPF